MDTQLLEKTFAACLDLIERRFPAQDDRGAAAMLLDDGTVVTGTAPEAANPSVEVCHEVEPYCAAYRLGRRVLASVCLHRLPGGRTIVLSPCGVCRERLAVHGPGVMVAVPAPQDLSAPVWKPLGDVLPDYWMNAFPEEVDPDWLDRP